MFSGIIEKKAKILGIENGNYTIENIWNSPLRMGESIAHDGACMTVTSSDENTYQFFAMEETIKKTNFGGKKTGDSFNAERSLKLSESLDGHFVSGHIDGVGTIENVTQNEDGSLLITLSFEKKFKNLIIQKGSIALSGVSLTVVDDKENKLSVSIIPLTQELTNLGTLKKGDQVNIEFDMLGKYINKIYSNSQDNV